MYQKFYEYKSLKAESYFRFFFRQSNKNYKESSICVFSRVGRETAINRGFFCIAFVFFILLHWYLLLLDNDNIKMKDSLNCKVLKFIIIILSYLNIFYCSPLEQNLKENELMIMVKRLFKNIFKGFSICLSMICNKFNFTEFFRFQKYFRREL